MSLLSISVDGNLVTLFFSIPRNVSAADYLTNSKMKLKCIAAEKFPCHFKRPIKQETKEVWQWQA